MLPSKALTQVIRDWSEIYMRHSMRDFRQFMVGNSLSLSHVNVLMRLYHQGRCSRSDLSDELGITLPAASQAIDRLVNMGFIGRSEDPDDRRSKQLVLTDKGRQLMSDAIEARSLWIEGLTTALDAEEREQIISALNLLNEAAIKLDN